MWWTAGAALLVVAAAVATVLVATRGTGDPPPPAVPVAAAGPASPATTPPTLVAPPPAVPISLIPSQVPGWLATVSTTRNAAYDVPPTWRPGSPGSIRGFHDDAGNAVVLSGVAEHESAPCPGSTDQQMAAWAGTTGAPTADTARAARALAGLWAGYFATDTAKPQIRIGPPTSVTVAGKPASHVVADVTVPGPDTCENPARATIHTVAAPARNGQSLVWVALVDNDIPDGVGDADVDQMIRSLRPAGLEVKCDPSRVAVGTWC
jgi:hypothetical protein